MQKSGTKEPIYLSKLKRKSKIIEHKTQDNMITRENIIYDIQALQAASSKQKIKEVNDNI
jgi:hypothetical protein